ncbi:MAG TPA: phosphodiester glycosidase family protein [Chitinophagaceae bacterium]|nr:phosphodiester glycosidase family protein [Chitinophagaceae bacterium]
MIIHRVVFLVALKLFLFPQFSFAQLRWQNVDSLFQPLPASVHVYFTEEKIDTGSFRAYYLIADLKDKKLDFTVDTTLNRRLTPSKFYEKNAKPVAIVNCTFFSFETNRNLNAVIRNGKLLAYNNHTIPRRGKDTLTYMHPFGSALGISKKRRADVAWLFTDSSRRYAYASQFARKASMDSVPSLPFAFVMSIKHTFILHPKPSDYEKTFTKWRMRTAIGGGPVLLSKGQIDISNNEELKFAGKAINDKHPRTAMGYTKDGKLIILVIQGRSESSGGATLVQEAQILKDLGCWEALNLDGGGSSCLLVNGRETIKPSDKEGQRPVPAVFLIRVWP